MSDDTPASTDAAECRSAPEAALAHEIRRRREAAGLSQSQLANLIGYSRQYVSRAERPSAGLASGDLVKVIDAALSTGGALLELHAAFAGSVSLDGSRYKGKGTSFNRPLPGHR